MLRHLILLTLSFTFIHHSNSINTIISMFLRIEISTKYEFLSISLYRQKSISNSCDQI